MSHPAPDVSAAVARLAEVGAIVASGRRLQGVAEAAALGLCELARLPAFALEGGQLRHGPMEMMGPDPGRCCSAAPRSTPAGWRAWRTRPPGQGQGGAVRRIRCGTGGWGGMQHPAGRAGDGGDPDHPADDAALMLGVAAARVPDVGNPRRSSKITRIE
ncbi:MAG: hypothetical protein U1E48_07515 [Paracoccaceae bacterium]